MATIYRRGSVWWGRVQRNGRDIRKSLDTTSRPTAERRLRRWLDDIDATSWGEITPYTYDDMMLHFLTEHVPTLRPTAQRRYRTSARMMQGHFTGKRLSEITRSTLLDFEGLRRAGFISEDGKEHPPASAPTIRRDLACLSSAWEGFVAAKDLELPNPVQPFMRARRRRGGLKENPPRDRYLSHDEEAALLAAAPAYLEPLIAFAIDTGLRLEEQLSLTWSDVDLARCELTVVGKGRKLRKVPILTRAGTILGTLPRHIRRHGEPDWVFCKRDGSRYGKLTRGLEGARKRGGLKPLIWHDLRRTCGCRLLQDHGMMKQQVQLWLGHASLSTTERSYAFLRIDDLHEGVGTKTGTGHADSQSPEAGSGSK